MARVRLYPRREIGGFWQCVVDVARHLPDETLLRMVHLHLEQASPGDPLAALLRWREAGSPERPSCELALRPVLVSPVARRDQTVVAPVLEGGLPPVERFVPSRRMAPPPSQAWIRLPGRELDEGEHPPAPVVHLVVLPVEKVKRSKHVFECVVYEARIRAKTCISRQYTAYELKRVGRGAQRQRLGTQSQYVSCGDCGVGRQIQKQVIAKDRREVQERVTRVKDGRLPPKYASGPIRD